MAQAVSTPPTHAVASSDRDDVLDRVERLHGHLASLGGATSVADVAGILARAAVETSHATCARVLLSDAAATLPCHDPTCDLCGPAALLGPPEGADMSWRLREGRLLLGHSRGDDVSNRLVAWLIEQAGLALDRTRRSESAAAAVDALLHAERERSELVEVLAHDLRSPMTALHGFASLLADHWSDLDETRRRDLLSMIQRETGRMNRLVDDVTNAVLGPSAQLPLRLAQVDVGAIARDLVVATQGACPTHTIRSVIGPGTPRALADADRVAQILSNLLENFARHTPQGSIAVVHVGRGRDGVVVTVADDGPGIAPADLEQIFHRGGRGADAVVSGNGLGLHTGRSMAQAMGGSLAVHDGGPGATFLLTLPLAGPRPVD